MRILLILFFAACCFSLQAQVFIKNKETQTDTLHTNPEALRFMVLGDWGRNGADHQRQVAAQMDTIANRYFPDFFISTGDNFYPSGVASEWDPLWKYSFEDIYTGFRLQWNWYPVLGNHDYKSNPEAQVRYSGISRRWQMPARYYSKLISLPDDTSKKVLILFIDTNPLIPEFYSNKEYGPRVKTQDSTKQKKWIEQTLKHAPENVQWKIVVGHHPMYSGGSRVNGYDTKAIRRVLETTFTKYKVDIYISGHEHSLQHIFNVQGLHHFISGAASEKTPAGPVPGSRFAASAYGFMNFSLTPGKAVVQAISDEGKILYTTTLTK